MGVPHTVVLSFSDPQGMFMSNKIDVSVPGTTASTASAGIIQMSTRDGLGCAALDSACWNNKAIAKKDLIFNVLSTETGNALPGASVTLNRQFAESAYEVVQTLTTNA